MSAVLHALVVEDDKNALARWPSWSPTRVSRSKTAASVRGGALRLCAQTPDVVLLDLILPDGTGFDLIQDLQGRRTGGDRRDHRPRQRGHRGRGAASRRHDYSPSRWIPRA
jgi:CheY-like chemotaxis protein